MSATAVRDWPDMKLHRQALADRTLLKPRTIGCTRLVVHMCEKILPRLANLNRVWILLVQGFPKLQFADRYGIGRTRIAAGIAVGCGPDLLGTAPDRDERIICIPIPLAMLANRHRVF